MKYLLWIPVICLAALLCHSCSSQGQEGSERRILVIHSYKDLGEEGLPFRQAMEKAFRSEGIKAQIHHVYLDLVHQDTTLSDRQEGSLLQDSILHFWKPEVILLNDDPALGWARNHLSGPSFQAIPTVIAGMSALDSRQLFGYRNVTGFEDKIDLKKNCDLFCSLTGERLLSVESDPGYRLDDSLRQEFFQVLKDTSLYVNNADYHVDTSLENQQQLRNGKKLIVTFFSLNDPESNRYYDTPPQHGIFITSKLLKHASKNHFLNVKQDIFSFMAIDRCGVPQLTAVREGFNNPDWVRFLCGYFTSMETQVKDQVNYAAQILKGTHPSELPLSQHGKDYYLDYNALQLIKDNAHKDLYPAIQNLNYKQLSQRFQVLNVPFGVRNPLLFYSLVSAGAFLLILMLAILIGCVYYWNNYKLQGLLRELGKQAHKRSQILADTNSAVWRARNGMVELPLDFANRFKVPKSISVSEMTSMIDTKSQKEWFRLANYYRSKKLGQDRVRIHITFDKGKSWHWYDLIYNVTPQSLKKWELTGLFLNIDREMQREQQMQHALNQAQEIQLKEYFLENTSQNLQFPIRQIQNNLQILTDPAKTLTGKERDLCNKKIQDGGQILLNKIDSLVKQKSKNRFSTLLLILAMIPLLNSCTQSRKPLKVLLLHQYSEQVKGYQEFHQSLTRTFREQGYEPDYRNVYLDLEDQVQSPGTGHTAYEQAVDSGKWKADVILGEGDRTVRFVYQAENETIPSYRDQVPVIYGGLNFPDWSTLNRFKNVTAITDPMDLAKNLDLAREFTGKNCIEIELDHAMEDEEIRQQLREELQPAPYLFDEDYHLKNLSLEYLEKHYPDSLIVLPLSASEPEGIIPDTALAKGPSDWLKSYFIHAGKYPQLVVKRDVWGESLCNQTDTPQFTSKRELLGEKPGQYLAGYFADYATVGRDMASAAVNQLNGQGGHLIRAHEKRYYMDYEAAQYLGLDIDRYKDQFTFKNAPFRITHPTAYLVTAVCGAGIALAFTIYILYMLLYVRNRKLRQMQNMLKEENELDRLILQNGWCQYFTGREELVQLLSHMDPADKQQKRDIMLSMNEPGSHVFRLQADLQETGQKDWWQLRYTVSQDKSGEMQLEGIILDINDTIRQEEQLQQTEQLENESREKENFLWKIAHEIRTPLNCIIGFADLLTNQGDELGPDEKAEISSYMKKSFQDLQKIIYDMVHYAHIINDKETYLQQDFDISKLTEKCYDESRDWFRKNGQQLTLSPGRSGIWVQADEEKVTSSIQELLDNAQKFCPEGKVTIGWQYKLDTRMVEISVEDNGPGISRQKLPALFSMFWKNDGFIPGLGIGLNIVQSYARAMGGDLFVETEEGRGSRFILTLPTVKP